MQKSWQKRTGIWIWIVVALAVIPLGCSSPSTATGGNHTRCNSISISPATQTVNVGDTFTVDVVLNSDVQSRGAQLSLGINPNSGLVKLESVSEGSYFKDFGKTMTFGTDKNNLDPNVGTKVPVAVVLQGGEGGPTGSGTLFTFSFTAKSAGEVTLCLSQIEIPDAQLQPIKMNVNCGKIIIQ